METGYPLSEEELQATCAVVARVLGHSLDREQALIEIGR